MVTYNMNKYNRQMKLKIAFAYFQRFIQVNIYNMRKPVKCELDSPKIPQQFQHCSSTGNKIYKS